jgi:hypothetical protein
MEEIKIPIINQFLNLNEAAAETLKLKNPIEEKLVKKYSEELNNHPENIKLIKNFEDLSKKLIAMGVKPKIALNGLLVFKYSNIEEALELSCKSSEGEYNHRFIPSDESLCFICGEADANHRSIDKILSNKSIFRNSLIEEDENLKMKITEKEIILRKRFSRNENRISNLSSDKRIFELKNLKCDNKLDKSNEKLIFDVSYNLNNKFDDKFNNKDKKSVECPICFMDIGQSNTFSLNCNHFFCVDCIKDYLDEEIKNSRVAKINCPQKNCSCKFEEKFIEELVSEDMLSKFRKFLEREKYKNNQNVICCPISNCEGYATKADSLDEKGNFYI